MAIGLAVLEEGILTAAGVVCWTVLAFVGSLVVVMVARRGVRVLGFKIWGAVVIFTGTAVLDCAMLAVGLGKFE